MSDKAVKVGPIAYEVIGLIRDDLHACGVNATRKEVAELAVHYLHALKPQVLPMVRRMLKG